MFLRFNLGLVSLTELSHVRLIAFEQCQIHKVLKSKNLKECCFIRKVEPLQRALKGYDIWITGIRAEQSDERKDIISIEWDEANKIIKFHPLLNWSLDKVKYYIAKHNIPYNPLHDKGFVSIGCAPCTRAIKTGEDFRAGRWWWEENNKKECGLHSN